MSYYGILSIFWTHFGRIPHLYYVTDSGKQIGVGGTTTTVESASTTSNPSKPSIPNSGVYTFKGHSSIKAEPKISAPELAYPDVGH